MQKVELKKGFVFYGYEVQMPDEVIILYSYTPKPTENKNSAFGFMWQAYYDGEKHFEVRHFYSDNFFLTNAEKEDMAEVVRNSAIRYFDELFKLRHQKIYEQNTHTGN